MSSDEKIVLDLAAARRLRRALRGFESLARVLDEAILLVGTIQPQGTVKATSVTFWITTHERVEEVRGS